MTVFSQKSGGKIFKLAPFKLRFAKRTKSRGEGEASRSNSVECEETNQQQVEPVQSLVNSNSRPGTPATEGNLVTTGNAIPNSPPPSYEHVLEETRLVQSTSNTQETEEQDEEMEEQMRQERMAIRESSTGSGGGPGATIRTPAKGPEILHKSSKELYRAVAKQWGITCKMSDHCRCLDCQSHYFDCEYEKDEQEKTDGGLGAGTPMFISEMMHGATCVIL
ncbi:uncharacterized protein LOC105696490 [Orussus abietinus]|uniref:uncharacterized protein LOC105696490 n=1 Tax=Orussus abietinus TaxID=222816 RepID=UPI0006256375|nr:uncharacterized protein LOC105696490 [Orussus abietinus]